MSFVNTPRQRLDAEGQRGDVQKKNAFNVSAKNAALYSSAYCDALVGVNALKGIFAGNGFNCVLNGWHTRSNRQPAVFLKARLLKDRNRPAPA